MALSPIDLILGPQAPIGDNYFDQTFLAKAKQYGIACPATPPTNESDLNSFVLLNYYDLPHIQYIAHRRTNDPFFLELGRKCADSWWLHPTWISGGKIQLWPDNASPPPRHAGIAGLILRALDGRPEMWEWINLYVQYFFHIYIGRNIGHTLTGVREEAFVFHYATWLAMALPDSFPLRNGGTATNGAALRAQHLANVENAAINFFGRSQLASGAWTWSDPGFTDNDGGTLLNVTQPFMIGLLTSALVDAHQVVQSETAKESVKNQILRACRHLYSDGPYIKDEIELNSGVRIRGFHYFYHGGTTVNPTRYAQGDIKFPWRATEAWWLPSARQAISTILPAFGYAYKISGDEFFKQAGEELWDSAYSGRDGKRAMLDDTAKNFNQHARRGGSYRAWLGGDIAPPVPAPVPLPVPAPSPAPPPPPAPSPDITRPVVTIDSPTSGSTLKGIVEVRATASDNVKIDSIYLIVDGMTAGQFSVAPHVYKLDTSRLSDGSHVMKARAWDGSGNAGDSKEVAFTAANTVVAPPPAPAPTPTTRTVSYPKQPSKRNAILDAQWKERFRLKSESDTTAVFEKVP